MIIQNIVNQTKKKRLLIFQNQDKHLYTLVPTCGLEKEQLSSLST